MNEQILNVKRDEELAAAVGRFEVNEYLADKPTVYTQFMGEHHKEQQALLESYSDGVYAYNRDPICTLRVLSDNSYIRLFEKSRFMIDSKKDVLAEYVDYHNNYVVSKFLKNNINNYTFLPKFLFETEK